MPAELCPRVNPFGSVGDEELKLDQNSPFEEDSKTKSSNAISNINKSPSQRALKIFPLRIGATSVAPLISVPASAMRTTWSGLSFLL